MLYRASNIGTKLPDKMSATNAPLEVGTRGTIGSLLKKEIEYFKRIELEYTYRGTSSIKPQKNTVESQSANGGNSSWLGLGFLMLKWKKKKKRVNGGGGLQSVCSLVDVSDSHRMNEIRGFSYVNLKVDSKRFEEQTVLS